MNNKQKAEPPAMAHAVNTDYAGFALTRQMPHIGAVRIVQRGQHIVQLDLGGKAPYEPLTDVVEQETPLLRQAFEQLSGYLAGVRKEFDLPLAPVGTPFQRKVWDALLRIPYGQTRSYQQIAQAVGSPKGFRAVGMANNRNPIAVFIPCHRVVGADGNMVGYGGGVDIKVALLGLEDCKLTQSTSGWKVAKKP